MADVCAPTYEASPKRWTERAKTSGNSHCGPIEIGKACRPLGFSPTYEIAAREAEARIPFGLPRSDGERQDEVVVRPFTPVEGVFGPFVAHIEAKVDEFPG